MRQELDLALPSPRDSETDHKKGRKRHHLSRAIWEGRTPLTKNREHTWHASLSGGGNMWWEIFH